MRLDLKPYVDHPVEVVEGAVWMRLREYQGEDATVDDIGRAVLGAKVKRSNARDVIRYCLRNEIEQPFRHVTAVWEVTVPEEIRRDFQVLGKWTWDDRQGAPYAFAQGRSRAFGIWAVDLWDMLALMHRWSAFQSNPELRYCARHVTTVVRKWMPLVFDAYQDYLLHGARLSHVEINVLRDGFEELIALRQGDFDLQSWWRSLLVKRNIFAEEQDEFLTKLEIQLWARRRRS